MAGINQEIIDAIDQHLEEIYPSSIDLAAKFGKCSFKTSQLRGFETLVFSTSRFSEILNYIKGQAGKDNRIAREWRKVAGEMLDQLGSLEKKAHELGGGDPRKIMEIKLRLARGWARQVISHWLYVKDKD